MMTELEEKIRNEVGSLVSQFREMDKEALKITKMPGMSNDVFKVEGENHEVIYKHLKDKGEVDLFTRHEATIKRIVSLNKVGPKKYFEDKSKVVEEFISGETLTREQLYSQDTRLKILYPLAEYSKMGFDSETAMLNKKISLSEMIDRNLFGLVTNKIEVLKKNPYMNRTLTRMIEKMVAEFQEDNLLKNLLQKHNEAKEDLILCHNDFYHLNIIKSPDDRYFLIDYEYSCINPFGWDIANILTENTLCFNEDDFNFDVKIEHFPSYDDIFEMVKVFTIHFKSSEKLGEDAEFIQKMRRGEYDGLVNTMELSKKTANIFELCYILNATWLLWIVLKIGDPDCEWPMQDYVQKKWVLHKWFKHILNTPGLQNLMAINSLYTI